NEREDILAFGGGRVVQLFKVSYDANGVEGDKRRMLRVPEGRDGEGVPSPYAPVGLFWCSMDFH
ncbi:MAG: hypothetical protein II320_01950, partial [Oscillospiraceae bacterium]|nr:hypothetical protein [Oscillospiraceae bacterium]